MDLYEYLVKCASVPGPRKDLRRMLQGVVHDTHRWHGAAPGAFENVLTQGKVLPSGPAALFGAGGYFSTHAPIESYATGGAVGISRERLPFARKVSRGVHGTLMDFVVNHGSSHLSPRDVAMTAEGMHTPGIEQAIRARHLRRMAPTTPMLALGAHEGSLTVEQADALAHYRARFERERQTNPDRAQRRLDAGVNKTVGP